MKVLFLLCLLFCSGCVGNMYEHTKYSKGELTEKWTLQGYGANVTKQTDNLVIVLGDGSRLMLGKMYTWPDPNSAKAVGEAGGTFMRFLLVPSL